MLLSILKEFLPWILFFVLAGHSLQKLDIAIIVAFVFFLIFGTKELRKGFILSWGTFLFFIFMLVSVTILRSRWVATHAWIFSNAALALIAWVSLFIGKPFTMQYAREEVEQQYWKTPLFLKINQILTAIWGGLFLFCMLMNILKIYLPITHNEIYELLSDGASVFGICFTAWFPSWYRKKAQV